jgi:sec-independent protein translocase protein TatB
MFGIGSTELIVILVVALIVIGPAKLPEMAKSLGKALGEFRRVSTDVKRTIEMEAEQADQKSRTDQAKKELFPEQKASQAPQASQASQAAQTPQASQEAPKPPAAPAEVAAQAADESAESRTQEPVAEAAEAPAESVAKDKA